ADEARQVRGQMPEDRRPALRIARARHESARLVIEEEPRAVALGQRLAVDQDAIGGTAFERRRGGLLAVDLGAPGQDPLLRLAARAQPRPRDSLGDALGIDLALAVDHGVTWRAE